MVTEICFPFQVLPVWLDLSWEFVRWHLGDFPVQKCRSIEEQLLILSWPMNLRVLAKHCCKIEL